MNLKLQNVRQVFKNVRARTIIIVTLLILLVGFLLGFSHLTERTAPAADSSVTLKEAPNNIQSVPGGLKQPPSADYQRLQQQQNLQQAVLAEKTGASAIPTLLDSSAFQASQNKLGDGNNSCYRPCSCCQNPCAGNTALNCSGGSLLQPSDLRSGTLIYDANDKVIGRLGSDGKARSKARTILGQVGPDGLVRAPEGSVIGSAAVPAAGDPVYDASGHLIGTVGADGKVRDAEGHIIGTVSSDGTVREAKCAVIGKSAQQTDKNARAAVPGSPVYDRDGKLIGTVGSDGRIRDANGKVIGTLTPDATLLDKAQHVKAKVGATAPGVPLYNTEGHLMGTVGADGLVRDSRGRAIAKVGGDGIAHDSEGNPLGTTTPPPSLEASAAQSNSNQNTAVSLLPSASDSNNQALQAILDRQAQQISAQKAEQLQQQIQSSMSTQASQLFVAWVSPTQQYVAGTPLAQSSNGLSGINGLVNGAASLIATAPPAVKAGTIMYAVLLTAVNSDEPGPVLAEIVQGKFKGGRLVGALSKQGQKVLLSFNTLTLHKVSQSIPVNTVAIDESTARTALSSYTNNHNWLRYGMLFASAFIQGFGQSFLATGSPYAGAVVINPTNNAVNLNTRDRLFVGLGQVGLQYASALGSIFSTPPTVHVYSGTPMGILFLSDLPALPQE